VRVLDAMGLDVIIVETVGVGQDEIDIAQMAHTTLVLLVPGMGDDIQAIKAGILEVADLFVVNKADLPGADRVVRELRSMLELRHAVSAMPMNHDAHHRMHLGASAPTAAPAPVPVEWEPPILKVVAAREEGLDALIEGIEKHRLHLEESGEIKKRNRERAKMQFLLLLRERLMRNALGRLEKQSGQLEEVAERIALRNADPYALAEELAKQLEI
jgi:LAO/AO transport system kinase